MLLCPPDPLGCLLPPLRFSLGRRREEGESLALADHLMWRSRRGSGGRGWSGRDWPHHPNFDTDPPERAPERWEEANQVLQMAQDALRHQWMADVPPAAPTRPQRWVPPGVVSR